MSYIIGSISLAGTNSSTSISRLRSSGSVAMSSSVMTTSAAVVGLVGPRDVAVLDDLAALFAHPLVPDAPVVLGVNLWNFRSWSSVALYTLTGTFTRPKAIEPFQMERIAQYRPASRS